MSHNSKRQSNAAYKSQSSSKKPFKPSLNKEDISQEDPKSSDEE